MKKWLVLVMGGVTMILLVFGLAGVCGWSARYVFLSVLDNRLVDSDLRVRVFDACTANLPLVSKWRNWLENKNYIVPLQNSNEIRPSGGFMGSYIRIKTQRSGIKEFMVNDIYEPDGQIKGHVDPPYPIQEAFGQGWWRLRDANWEVDFTKAAPTIAWFFEQGGEEKPDGIVAINLQLVKKLLRVVGPLQLETYDELVNENNLDKLAQKYSAEGFVPGSSQKRDFLGAVAARIQIMIPVLGVREKVDLAKLLLDELNNGEMLLWFADSQIQNAISRLGWSGGVKIDPNADYVYIVESNFGVNKVNCCVFKEIEHHITSNEDRLLIGWKNENVSNVPTLPVFGGRYMAYVRILRPRGYNLKHLRVGGVELKPLPAELEQLRTPLWQEKTINYYQISNSDKFVSIGFWVVVDAQKSVGVELLTEPTNSKYSRLVVQKQPGSKPYIYRMRYLDNEKLASNIDRSVIIQFK